MSDKFDKLLRRYQVAKAESDMWQAYLTDCYAFAMPNRNTFANYSPGQEKSDRVFDSTAPTSVFKFASNLQSALVPTGRKWCKLIPGSAIREDGKDKLAKELDKYTNKIFEYLHNSNFDMAISEGLMDLSVGTMALLCNENDDDENPFIFEAVAIDQISPEESFLGTVETNWRRFKKLKGRYIEQMWPKATIPHNLASKIEHSPDEFVEIIDGVVYDQNHKGKDKYEYVVLAENEKVIIYSERIESSPWIIARWSKVPGETFGRGQIMQVLADIRMVNKIKELVIKGAVLRVAPPYMAFNDGTFNPDLVELEPNIVLVVDEPSVPNQWPLHPLPTNGDPNFADAKINELQMSIKDALFVDALGPVDAPKMTATEVYTRQQLLMKLIGSAFGRLQVEFLSKVIDRVIYILRKRGLIEPVVVDGKEITLKYQSPLAQAQDQDDINAFIQFVQIIAQTTGKNAEQAALLALKVNDIPMFLAEKLGVPLKLVNSSADIEKITENALQQMQSQQQNDFSLPIQPQAPQAMQEPM